MVRWRWSGGEIGEVWGDDDGDDDDDRHQQQKRPSF